MTKPVTYGFWPAIATPLRASKAQSNLRLGNIVKKGTKKFDQVKDENKRRITYLIYL